MQLSGGVEGHGGVGRQSLGHGSIGPIECGGQLVQVSVGVLGQPKAGEGRILGFRPGGAVQQLGPRIGPAVGGGSKDVPSPQGPVQRFEDTERVRATVDRPWFEVGGGIDQATPRPGDDLGHDLVITDLLATGQLGQAAQRLQDRPALGGGIEGDYLAEQG